MNKNYIIIFVALVAIFSLNSYLTPGLREKQVNKVITSFLDAWKEGNIPKVSAFWTDINLSNIPPISRIDSYTVNKTNIYKEKDRWQATAEVLLNISEEGMFPPQSNWELILIKSSLGWQVSSFNIK